MDYKPYFQRDYLRENPLANNDDLEYIWKQYVNEWVINNKNLNLKSIDEIKITFVKDDIIKNDFINTLNNGNDYFNEIETRS